MGLTMITGGARSGKSTFAEEMIKECATPMGTNGFAASVLYIATALPFDQEMKIRIRKHKEQRPDRWRTVEQYRGVGQVIAEAPEKIILLDCMTLMMTNILIEAELDEQMPDSAVVEKIEKDINAEVEDLLQAIRDDQQVIIVTNELGMGMVPHYPLGRIFRDIAGRVNRKVSAVSDKVYFVVSGIPSLIKGSE